MPHAGPAGEGRLETREKYGTRRHDQIESLTFDSQKNFASVEKTGMQRKRADRSSSSSLSALFSDTSRWKLFLNGWNSFGSFQMSKKPKHLVPCSKSMKDILRNLPESSSTAGSEVHEDGVKINMNTVAIVKSNE